MYIVLCVMHHVNNLVCCSQLSAGMMLSLGQPKSGCGSMQRGVEVRNGGGGGGGRAFVKHQGMGSNPIVDIFFSIKKTQFFLFYFNSPDAIPLRKLDMHFGWGTHAKCIKCAKYLRAYTLYIICVYIILNSKFTSV